MQALVWSRLDYRNSLTNGIFSSCLNSLHENPVSSCFPPSERNLKTLLSLPISFTFNLLICRQTLEIATLAYVYKKIHQEP